MCLTDVLEEFVNRLKHNPDLDEVHIIKAYPFVSKPTQLDRAVLAVSPSIIEGESVAIGDSKIFASYTIDVDIFVPQDMGSPEMWEYIKAVLSAQKDSYPSAVSASRVWVNNEISCYCSRCSFTYNGELELKED